MLFANVTVKRCLARDGRGHVLGIVGRSSHNLPAGLDDSDVIDIEALECTLVRESEQAIALDAGVGLDTNAGGRLARPRAIVLKRNLVSGLLDNERFS